MDAYLAIVGGLIVIVMAGVTALADYNRKVSSYTDESELFSSYIHFEENRKPLDEETIRKSIEERYKQKKD